jgi:methylated-DNA-[protein]-cysteine S-methyltransferase
LAAFWLICRTGVYLSIVTRTESKRYFFKEIESPVGGLKLVASEAGLAAILWEHENPRRVPLSKAVPDDRHPTLLKTERQLSEYFAGRLKRFDLELDFAGTPFQCRVWRALLTIPYGETRTYTGIARQIGNPTAIRAVGAANGRNPISIVVPCHRVLGATGKLTGFAGGLDAKAYLLALEAPRSAEQRLTLNSVVHRIPTISAQSSNHHDAPGPQPLAKTA